MSRANPKTIEICRKKIEAMRVLPPGELLASMIARGAIDEQGRVLYGGKPSKSGQKSNSRKSNGSVGKKKSSNGKHS